MRRQAEGHGRERARGKRAESGQSGGEARGSERRTRSSGKEPRLTEVLSMSQRSEKQTGVRGPLKDGGDVESRSKGKRVKEEEEEVNDITRELRWRVNRLEKDKLQLTSRHNQEACGLEAEVARLRAALERGEAERAELQYELTVSHRETEKETQRNGELQRETQTLTERHAELQQSLHDLHKALDLTRLGRDQDQQVLQQEVDERDRLIQSLKDDNQRLHRLLLEQEQALEQSEQRMVELHREAQKEAELSRRQAEELRYLSDREERLRTDKQFLEQKVKSLESNIEAERAAHLESKFNSELVQLRLRDLEAALAAERSDLQEATCSVERLRAQIRETEKQREQEQQRSSQAFAQLHRLQQESEQCKSDLSVALETEKSTTSDLRGRLDSEQRRLESTSSQLQQATQEQSQTQKAFVKFVQDVKETLQQHLDSAEDCGSWSPEETVKQLKTRLCVQKKKQEKTDKQIEDLQLVLEQLHDENKSLTELSSRQKTETEQSERLILKLKEEVMRLQTESCDWSNQSRQLQVELQRERDERKTEREEKEEEVRLMTEHHQKESEARLSSLHDLLRRLQPQSIMGHLTWDELWSVVSEGVEQMNSDTHKAKHQVASLQSVLHRLEDKVKKREQDWAKRHQQTVAQLFNDLQLSRSECESLQSHVSSLTSDLSVLCNETSRFQWACHLLGGALTHSQVRLKRLSEQKVLLSRRLGERDVMEQELRLLAAALEANDEDEEEEKKRRAQRRWRKGVSAVTTLRRWSLMGKTSPVLFRLQTVGVSLCGDATGRKEGQKDDETREARFTRWLRSKRISSVVLSSMSELQGALSGSGSSPQTVMSAAQSGLSRLLAHLFSQSDAAPALSEQHSPTRRMSMQPHMKCFQTLVSGLQQHFLNFSQRLHSTEVERRSLRLELTELKRAAKKKSIEDADKTVPSERFHRVCSELREALGREQEAQTFVQELNSQLTALRLKVDSVSAENMDAQLSLDRTTQSLSEARQEVCRKERSLRILGKHLSGVQKERRQLEERLRETQDELQDTTKRKEQLMGLMRTSENKCSQLRESLLQSHRSLSCKPRPLTLPDALSGAESIMGDPAVAACQSLLSSVALLAQTFSSRIGWLQQEVSAHQSHVTALRSELQDACLRQNQAFTSAVDFPDSSSFIDVGQSRPVPLSEDKLKGETIT